MLSNTARGGSPLLDHERAAFILHPPQKIAEVRAGSKCRDNDTVAPRWFRHELNSLFRLYESGQLLPQMILAHG
jgi:hypothetical protein